MNTVLCGRASRRFAAAIVVPFLIVATTPVAALTYSVTSNTVSGTSTDADFNYDGFVFAAFDTTLGTLDAVNIRYDLTYNGSASVTYRPRNAINNFYTASVRAEGRLGETGDTIFLVDRFSDSRTEGSCGWTCINPQDSRTITASGSGTTTASLLLRDPDSLARFQTGSTVSLLNQLSVGATNGYMTASAALQVQYRYTAVSAAVPEPASWAMMIGGFGLVGGRLRRRRTTVRFA